MSDDRKIGLAYVCERQHSGQRSRGYRLMSKIGWAPKTDRAADLVPREEWAEARRWAAHYMRAARAGLRF